MLLDGPQRWRTDPPDPGRQGRARPGAAGTDRTGAPDPRDRGLSGDRNSDRDREEPEYALPPLVDQHGAGVSHGELGLGSFESLLAGAIGSHGPAPPGTTFFDTWLGLAVRRWCPPLLGLAPHCTPAHYLAARREVGAYRATRLLLRGSGVGAYLLADAADEAGGADPAGGSCSAAELASAADAPVHRVLPLRRLAGRLADAATSTRGFLDAVADSLAPAPQHAVALALAVDGALPGAAPERATVWRAADHWLRDRRPGTPPAAPALVHHLLWSAVASRLPVQLHCREGADVGAFLAATRGYGTDLVLLPGPGPRVGVGAGQDHLWAARLAARFPHVYADVGPAPQETLRHAPFGKLMFATGAWALPELYVVAARQFTEAVGRLVREWTADGVCTEPEAWRIASLVAAGTARRVYRLPAAAGSSTAG
ncbi:amidohydrolase [Streptomyces sp. 796.1]|uniref:amidohydrolase n=1 Tax=Streptomyces sp. 796.1 TaxID=3163029 RepID=UPI0039C9B257